MTLTTLASHPPLSSACHWHRPAETSSKFARWPTRPICAFQGAGTPHRCWRRDCISYSDRRGSQRRGFDNKGRRAPRRPDHLYQGPIGYATQPKVDKRGQHFVAAEVRQSRLGISASGETRPRRFAAAPDYGGIVPLSSTVIRGG